MHLSIVAEFAHVVEELNSGSVAKVANDFGIVVFSNHTVKEYLQLYVWEYFDIFAFGIYLGEIPRITNANKVEVIKLLKRTTDLRIVHTFREVPEHRKRLINNVVLKEISSSE